MPGRVSHRLTLLGLSCLACGACGDDDADASLTAEPPEIQRHASDWPLANRDYENTRATCDSSLRASNVATLEERFRVPLTPQRPSSPSFLATISFMISFVPA